MGMRNYQSAGFYGRVAVQESTLGPKPNINVL